jgi:hypothetical protein
MDEKKLFQLLKQNLIPDLEKTDLFNPKDCTSTALNLSIELKCRRHHYDFLLLEKKKYDSLIKNKRIRYICSTPKGIYSFNLKKLKDIVWFHDWLPATTDFYNSEIVMKEITFLNINDATNISKLLGYTFD